MIKAITITWFLNLIKNWFIVLLRTVKEKELEKKKIIVKYDLSSSIYFTSMRQVIIAFLQFLMIDVIPERYPICIKQTKIWTYNTMQTCQHIFGKTVFACCGSIRFFPLLEA